MAVNSQTRLNPRYRQRSYYPFSVTMPTRWSDNDQYGHVNNTRYLEFADMVTNTYLIKKCGLDTTSTTDPLAIVVHTSAYFFEQLSFPDIVEVGCAIVKLGTSSVTYRVGVFVKQDPDSKVRRDPRACAIVDFVHVYCDNKTRRPIPIPDKARRELEEILRPEGESPKL